MEGRSPRLLPAPAWIPRQLDVSSYDNIPTLVLPRFGYGLSNARRVRNAGRGAPRSSPSMTAQDPVAPKRLLFVCVENSNRSQMAEAFARLLGGERVDAHSAGSKPSGKINPRAVASMRLLDYDLATHRSKSIGEIPPGEYDAVVAMGCGDDCSRVPARIREEWQIPDPKHMQPDDFASVRDQIRACVESLLARLG